MDHKERRAGAQRAWVAWGLDAKRSTPERRGEADAAGAALAVAMGLTGGESIDADVLAAWVGVDVNQFIDEAADELVRQDIANDTPAEREVRDALDAADFGDE